MPEGFEGVREAAKEIEQRKNSGGKGFDRTLFLKLAENEKATVRFLEQGGKDNPIKWAWTHKMPPQGKQRWGDDLPCLDQKRQGVPCPACQSELTVMDNGKQRPVKKRSFQGYINVIWFEAPVYQTEEVEIQTESGPKTVTQNVKDAAGKWIKIGEKPQVAVWNQGITVFEELDGIDATYKGLSSRRFVVQRKGAGLNTKHTIRPLDPDGGPQPFDQLETELAATKYDLAPYVTPLSFEDMAAKLGGGVDLSHPQQASHVDGSADVDSISAFM